MDSANSVGLAREVAVTNTTFTEFTHDGAEIGRFPYFFLGPVGNDGFLDNPCLSYGESLTLCRAIIVVASSSTEHSVFELWVANLHRSIYVTSFSTEGTDSIEAGFA